MQVVTVGLLDEIPATADSCVSVILLTIPTGHLEISLELCNVCLSALSFFSNHHLSI